MGRGRMSGARDVNHTHCPTRVSAAPCFEPVALSLNVRCRTKLQIQSTAAISAKDLVETWREDSLHEFLCEGSCHVDVDVVRGAAVSAGLRRPRDKTHASMWKHVKTRHWHRFAVEIPIKKRRRQQQQTRRSPKIMDEHRTSRHTSTVTWQATSPGSTSRAPTRRGNNLEKDFENDLDKNCVTTKTRFCATSISTNITQYLCENTDAQTLNQPQTSQMMTHDEPSPTCSERNKQQVSGTKRQDSQTLTFWSPY